MFEQILNAELAGIWTKVELDLTFPLLDMARYGAQKGPMCLTCVPVTLCRKIFGFFGGGGGGHKLPVHYIEHLMY